MIKIIQVSHFDAGDRGEDVAKIGSRGDGGQGIMEGIASVL